MKLDLSSDIEFNERLYDRDNGEGKAKSIIDSIRSIERLDNNIKNIIY